MRPLNEVIQDIKKHWKKPYFGAVPYLEALSKCQKITDTYMFEDAASLVNYLLANMQTFRGEKAKELKNELKEMLKENA